MTSNATQNRAPIGALRMSTIAVAGVIKDCSGGGCGPIDIVVSVPRGVSAQATTSDGTDGRTAYYDAVHTTNGVESLTNVQDRTSPDEIDATTTNGDVTIS